jgi:small conductance mechanosensitive channel
MRNDGNYAHNILEPIEILGLDKFADSAVIVRARTKTRPIKQWEVGREFNRRLKKRFDEDGIEIPFPHRTIYIGEDKAGHSPALNVHFEQDAAQQETSEDTVQQSASEDHDKPSDAPTPETDEASRMGE